MLPQFDYVAQRDRVARVALIERRFDITVALASLRALNALPPPESYICLYAFNINGVLYGKRNTEQGMASSQVRINLQ